MTLTEISIVKNGTKDHREYPHHRTNCHERHGLKTTSVFLPADGEASWSSLQTCSQFFDVFQSVGIFVPSFLPEEIPREN